MELSEAIKHCEEVAEEQEKLCRVNDSFNISQPKWRECGKEHRQLAEWLKELKRLREQESCEDAISRAEALKAINKMDIPEDMSVFEIKSHIGVEIGTLPPVQPKIKTGQWIVQPSNEEQGERPFIWWKCSNCGQVIFSETTHDRLEFHAFCGRCGAKMVEPQESEG